MLTEWLKVEMTDSPSTGGDPLYFATNQVACGRNLIPSPKGKKSEINAMCPFYLAVV